MHDESDYTDYSLFYDRAYGSGAYFKDNDGKLINPAQFILGDDHYTKTSNELRVSSPKEYRYRFIGGLFFQRQAHDILQDYVVNNGDPLATSLRFPDGRARCGSPTSNAWTATPRCSGNSHTIFSRISPLRPGPATTRMTIRCKASTDSTRISAHQGTATCFTPFEPYRGAPCEDLNGRTTGSGTSPKVNLTYKFDNDRMIYAT